MHSAGRIAELLGRSDADQLSIGYFHTLREILQQPVTWLQTANDLASISSSLMETLHGVKSIVLTGSGSSEYAGECIGLTLQQNLSLPVETIGGGVLLTHASQAIAPIRPALMVSFARSGDSPESVGAVALMLATQPDIRHLVVTCNANGKLAKTYANNPRVKVIVLADATNDRSLVMTSSFTNMVLAASLLGMLHGPKKYISTAESLSRNAQAILQTHVDAVAELAQKNFNRVVFLASGPCLGAARESALKMLEMTAGKVSAVCETYLGLRHGPMSAVHPDTLIVCFLSAGPLVRAYECDLVRELNDKQLGVAKLLFGRDIPKDLARDGDLVIECDAPAELADENMPVLDVLIGQLLAFFRCMNEGLKPDSPSASGVINRVVQKFRLHNFAE